MTATRDLDLAPKLYLVDTSSFIFRAYHALPPFTSPTGVPTGAVYGFCSMMYRLLDDHQPDYLAAVFDTGKPTFRNEMYSEYKANRPPTPEDLIPQFPLIERLVDSMNIPRVSQPGYEADDVIATLARLGQEQGMSVTIVSSDKDLMQLAGDRIRLLDTMKNKVFDPQEVEQKFGVPPALLGDWLALCGDSSDNVPGVPKIGPKTATKLLTRFHDLETLLASTGELKGKMKENLETFADQARLSRRLVELETRCELEVTVADLARAEPDEKALWDLFGELGFSRLRQRVSPGTVVDRSAYRLVLDLAQLQECLDLIRAAGRCAVDVETTSLDPMRASLVGISLAWAAGEACYIPLGHSYLGRPKMLETRVVLEALGPMLCDEGFPKTGQNYKYDWLVLQQAGVEMRGVVFDPMLGSYVLNPSRNTHGLDDLALDHLGHTMIPFKDVVGNEPSFESVELERATEYAAEDADVTLRLWDLLSERLDREEDLQGLLTDMEMPLSRLLAQMELHGVMLDPSRLDAMNGGIISQLHTLEDDVRRQAGWDVNINSPKQLQRLLFEQLGLTTGRKTKTGYSTDADVLADLAVEHPIAAQIDEYRTLAKLKNTYIDTLPGLINPRTGRVHTSYNQAVAATGRLSSSDPNLQNIPIRTELGRQIREAFVAPPGRVLVSADYSQVELRVLAHLSHDALLLEAFGSGQDVHQRTASEVFGIPADQVTPEQRRVAKAVNFGVIYGQTDWGLSRQLRIPKHTAKQYIDSYFQRYAGVKQFMEQTIEQAREARMVHTLLGRRRPLPDITSSRRNNRMYAERVARNTPIQGTAADLMKLAMLKVDATLASAGLDAPMTLTVHDELVLEVKREEVERVSGLVVGAMASVMDLDVPLKVDVGVGDSWAEAHG